MFVRYPGGRKSAGPPPEPGKTGAAADFVTSVPAVLEIFPLCCYHPVQVSLKSADRKIFLILFAGNMVLTQGESQLFPNESLEQADRNRDNCLDGPAARITAAGNRKISAKKPKNERQ
jgi:hypothetical protein